MAVSEEPEGVLEQARRAANAEREAGPRDWTVIADEVMRRARRVRVPEEPVLAEVTPDGGRTVVSTRVLLATVRRLLSAAPTHAPHDISFRVTDERLTGVEVELVAAYGVDLVELADGVRTELTREMDHLVGYPGAAPVGVDVAIVDVVPGDPRRV